MKKRTLSPNYHHSEDSVRAIRKRQRKSRIRARKRAKRSWKGHRP